MSFQEKLSQREANAIINIQTREEKHQVKINECFSQKFLLDKAGIFAKKEKNEAFMVDLDQMIDQIQEIKKEIAAKEFVFKNEEISKKKALIEKLIETINSKILKIDKCHSFVKYCKGEKGFQIPEDFLETKPDLDFVSVARHQFLKRIENCMEAQVFDYIFDALQFIIVQFCDYLLLDCLQKEKTQETQPDILSLLMICSAIKIKREADMGPQPKKERNSYRSRDKPAEPNKFKGEAMMNLLYIANRITHLPTLYVVLQIHDLSINDLPRDLQTPEPIEMNIKMLAWAEIINHELLNSQQNSDDQIQVYLDLQPKNSWEFHEWDKVERIKNTDIQEEISKLNSDKPYCSLSFSLKTLPCLTQALLTRLKKENLPNSNEDQTSYLRESSLAIFEWVYNYVTDKIKENPGQIMKIIPFSQYFQQFEKGINIYILPVIEAELVHAMQSKDDLFYKLGFISNQRALEDEALQEQIKRFIRLKDSPLEISKKLVLDSVQIYKDHLEKGNQAFNLVKNQYLASQYLKLYSSQLEDIRGQRVKDQFENLFDIKNQKIVTEFFGRTIESDDFDKLNSQNENYNPKTKQFFVDLLYQISYLKYQGTTLQNFTVKSKDLSEEAKEIFTKRVEISLYLLTNQEFQNYLWQIAGLFYFLMCENIKEINEQKELKYLSIRIKPCIDDLEQLAYQYLVQDPINLQSGEILHLNQNQIIQTILQKMVKPNYCQRESYKLDDNLLKQLKISNGKSDWHEEVEKLIDNKMNTEFKVKLRSTNQVSVIFNFKKQIQISGYAIRSSRYEPQFDPLKWNIKFKIPQTSNSSESESYYEVLNQEVKWTNRSQLKNFELDQTLMTDQAIFTFILDPKISSYYDRRDECEKEGGEEEESIENKNFALQMSEILFYSQKPQTNQEEISYFQKIFNILMQSLKNQKIYYNLQGISFMTQTCEPQKAQNQISLVKSLFSTIKQHLDSPGNNLEQFKDIFFEIFSPEIFEIIQTKRDTDEESFLASKVWEEYLQVFLTYLETQPILLQKLIQQGGLQKIMQFYSEQIKPTSQTLSIFLKFVKLLISDQKSLEIIKETKIIQSFLMPASNDHFKQITLASSIASFTDFYDIINSEKSFQKDAESAITSILNFLAQKLKIMQKKFYRHLKTYFGKSEKLAATSSLPQTTPYQKFLQEIIEQLCDSKEVYQILKELNKLCMFNSNDKDSSWKVYQKVFSQGEDSSEACYFSKFLDIYAMMCTLRPVFEQLTRKKEDQSIFDDLKCILHNILELDDKHKKLIQYQKFQHFIDTQLQSLKEIVISVAEQVGSHANFGIYNFDNEPQSSDQQPVRELRQVNPIDLFRKINSYQNTIEMKQKYKFYTGEIDKDFAQGHIIAQIQIIVFLFQDFFEQGRSDSLGTEALVNYLKDFKGIEISFVRCKYECRNLFYFYKDELAQRNYISTEVLKYMKYVYKQKTEKEEEIFKKICQFESNIESLYQDLFFVKFNNKKVFRTLKSLKNELSDRKELVQAKVDISSYDLDLVNISNEIKKVKEKGFNSPHFQVFMKNIKEIISQQLKEIKELQRDTYIQFIYDGKMGKFCNYFSFFKTLDVNVFIKDKKFDESKASKEELDKCLNYEAYLSFKDLIYQLKDKIQKFYSSFFYTPDEDSISQQSIYESVQEFYCNYFYQLITSIFYKDGYQKWQDKGEKEKSLFQLDQILQSQIQELDKNIAVNQDLREVQISLVLSISNSFRDCSELNCEQNSDQFQDNKKSREYQEERRDQDNKRQEDSESQTEEAKKLGDENKQKQRSCLISTQEFFKFFDKIQLQCYQLTNHWIQESKDINQKQKYQELNKEYAINVLKYNIFPKTFGQRKIVNLIYEQNFEQFQQKIAQLKEFELYSGQNRDCEALIRILDEAQNSIETLFKLQNTENLIEYFKSIKNNEYLNQEAFQNEVFQLLEILIQGKSKLGPKEYSLSQVQKLINQDNKLKFNFLNQSSSLIFKCLQMYRIYQQKFVNKFENVEQKLQELINQPKDDQNIGKQIEYKTKGLRYFKKIQQLYSTDFPQKVNIYSFASQSKLRELNLSEENLKDIQGLLTQLNDAGQFIQVISETFLQKFSLSIVLKDQNILIPSSDQNISLDLESAQTGGITKQQTLANGHLIMQRIQNAVLNNDRLIDQLAYIMKKYLSLRAKKQADYRLQKENQISKNIVEIQITQKDSEIDLQKFIDDFKKQVLGFEEKTQSEDSKILLLEQMFKAIPQVCQVQIKQDKFEGDIENSKIMLKQEIIEQINNNNEKEVELENEKEINLYQNLMSQLVESGQLLLKKVENSWSEDIVTFESVQSWNQITMLALRSLSSIARTSFDGKSRLIDRIQQDLRENNKYSLLNWFQNIYLPIRLLEMAKFDIINRNDVQVGEIYAQGQESEFKCRKAHVLKKFYGSPYQRQETKCDECKTEDIHLLQHLYHCDECKYDLCCQCSKDGSKGFQRITQEVSVFLIADYNQTLEKNVFFFLNELLGYGNLYSKIAILQRKTLRQEFLSSCLETLYEFVDKNGKNQPLGNGYLSIPIFQQSKIIGLVMIVQYLINQHAQFDENTIVLSNFCYRETIEFLFDWQSKNKTGSVNLILELQEQIQWITQLPYKKETNQIPYHFNKAQLLKKLKYIVNIGFSSQLLDRITEILQALAVLEIQLSDRSIYLQKQNQKSDVQEIDRVIKIKDNQNTLQQNKQSSEQNNQQLTQESSQPLKTDIIMQQNISNDQNILQNDKNKVDLNDIRDQVECVNEITFEHRHQWPTYDDNDKLDKIEKLALKIYPTLEYSDLQDPKQSKIKMENQISRIEKDVLYDYQPYFGYYRAKIDRTKLGGKQLNYNDCDYSDKNKISRLIQILRPISIQNLYNLAQIIEDKFFQTILDIQYKKEHRFKEKDGSLEYSYKFYLEHIYKEIQQFKGIKGLSFQNKLNSDEQDQRNRPEYSMNDDFPEVYIKPQKEINIKERIINFIQNLYDQGRIQKWNENKIGVNNNEIPKAKIDGLIYVQNLKGLGFSSLHFQEPGLNQSLPIISEPDKEFPKDWKTYKFPKYQDYIKRQSGSYISYSNENMQTDDGEKFPEKKYFLETSWDPKQRQFKGIIDWTKEPIDEGVIILLFECTFSEDYKIIKRGYRTSMDKQLKSGKNYYFEEEEASDYLNYKLYKERSFAEEQTQKNRLELLQQVKDPFLLRELLLELNQQEVQDLPKNLRTKVKEFLEPLKSSSNQQKVKQQELEDPSLKDFQELLIEIMKEQDQVKEDEAIKRKDKQNILQKARSFKQDKNEDKFIKNILQNYIFQDCRNYSKNLLDEVISQNDSEYHQSLVFKIKVFNSIVFLMKAVQEMDKNKFAEFFELGDDQQETALSQLSNEQIFRNGRTNSWNYIQKKLSIFLNTLIQADKNFVMAILKSFFNSEKQSNVELNQLVQDSTNIESRDGRNFPIYQTQSPFTILLKILSLDCYKLFELEQQNGDNQATDEIKDLKKNVACLRIPVRYFIDQLNLIYNDNYIQVDIKDDTLLKQAKELQVINDYKLVSTFSLMGQIQIQELINSLYEAYFDDKNMQQKAMKILFRITQLTMLDYHLCSQVKQVKSDIKIDQIMSSEIQEKNDLFEQASTQAAQNCLNNFELFVSASRDKLQKSINQVKDLAININKIDFKNLENLNEAKDDEIHNLKQLIEKFKNKTILFNQILSGCNHILLQLNEKRNIYYKVQKSLTQKMQENQKVQQEKKNSLKVLVSDQNEQSISKLFKSVSQLADEFKDILNLEEDDQKLLIFVNLNLKLLKEQISKIHDVYLSSQIQDFIDLGCQFLLSTQKITSQRDLLDEYSKALHIIIFQCFYPEMLLEVVNKQSNSFERGQVKIEKIEQLQVNQKQKMENPFDNLALVRQTSSLRKPNQRMNLLIKDQITDGSARLQFFNKFCLQNEYLLNKYLDDYYDSWKQKHKELEDVFIIMRLMPKLLTYKNKKAILKAELYKIKKEGSFTPNIARSDLFESAFQKFMTVEPQKLQSGFRVEFDGEHSYDAGGVSRDFFNSISKQIFNQDLGFFQSSDNGGTFMPNPRSIIQLDYEKYFRFIGRILGKAIMEECMLESYFVSSVYKMIIGQTLSFKDLQEIDNNLYTGLNWCLLPSSDVEELEETFSIDQEYFGQNKRIEIIPNGSEIQLNFENKEYYVERKAYYLLYLQVQKQMDALLEGFYDVIPKEIISIFSYKEIELLISGQPNYEISDLKVNTLYNSYDQNSKQIIWFWEVMESLNEIEKANFLQFVTGCSQVPVGGFAMLNGMSGLRKFSISKVHSDPKYSLPQAHTCYNQLDLPEYESKETLYEKLMMAIKETSGFGFF